MAAGLARAGMRPVLALYSTFMNRGFDQLIMDVALHREPVTVVLDRAGITGDDGASHNGVWDLSIAAMVPGLRTAAPRDGEELAALLREALAHDGPALLRYPKGALPEPIPALSSHSWGDVLFSGERPEVAVVAVGSMVPVALEAAGRSDVPVRVLDPRWALPVADGLVDELMSGYRGVVTVEDGLVDGGVGSEIALALARAGYTGGQAHIGVRREFLDHRTRASALAREGMTADDVLSGISAAGRADGPALLRPRGARSA